MKLLKYMFAKFLLSRMKLTEITEKDAKKFNHLQGIIITKGRIKLRLDKIGWTKKEPYIKGMEERRKKNKN